ncbi:hypothetical protein B0A65_07925 [Flavobacterium frigidimaris]|uniref:Uncharacterized protein n=1 Tax=Flavobacterium frigidimaris TaxID=262320 RepID=A0ABX4BRJ7_FLAFR|nr:hypothetical protein B0A65_07925 [Flavobacterium frigidimaris]
MIETPADYRSFLFIIGLDFFTTKCTKIFLSFGMLKTTEFAKLCELSFFNKTYENSLQTLYNLYSLCG